MTTAAAKTEPTPEAEAETGQRVPSLVMPNCLWRNFAGHRYSMWECRFPEGNIADDLKVPSIWRRCQQDGNSALKRWDELRIVAFDGSWVAHCIVAHASLTEVVLSKPKITTMPDSRENLFQDDTYLVRFVGNGYAVFRKYDDQQMAPAVHSAEAAMTVLLNQYPAKVG